ncbi:MAG: hypothetical protein ACAI38_01610 [Myxococcota bacterium]|nr:hypothetical protein [Myxococcota bacterium]
MHARDGGREQKLRDTFEQANQVVVARRHADGAASEIHRREVQASSVEGAQVHAALADIQRPQRRLTVFIGDHQGDDAVHLGRQANDGRRAIELLDKAVQHRHRY